MQSFSPSPSAVAATTPFDLFRQMQSGLVQRYLERYSHVVNNNGDLSVSSAVLVASHLVSIWNALDERMKKPYIEMNAKMMKMRIRHQQQTDRVVVVAAEEKEEKEEKEEEEEVEDVAEPAVSSAAPHENIIVNVQTPSAPTTLLIDDKIYDSDSPHSVPVNARSSCAEETDHPSLSFFMTKASCSIKLSPTITESCPAAMDIDQEEEEKEKEDNKMAVEEGIAAILLASSKVEEASPVVMVEDYQQQQQQQQILPDLDHLWIMEEDHQVPFFK